MFSAKDIHKAYRGTPVLNGISLDAERGAVIGLAGANGSGKSTLLGVMSGLIKPERGSVTIDGSAVSAASRRRLGFVPQESALFDDLSVSDNINFWAAAYKVKYSPRFFTGADLSKKAKQLSGGMRKRLNIELALINAPDYLIMDEPTSALDLVYQLQIMEIVKGLRAEGRGIIVASHNADELWACDRIYVLKSGLFVYAGTPEGFCGQPEFRERLYEIIKPSGSE